MLRVDGYLNEDLGPLPGPRSTIVTILLQTLQIWQIGYGLKGTDKDRLTRNFHSNFDLTSLTNFPNFNEKYYPEIAEIQVRKSGFLQITHKTYSVRWQALSRDAFLVEYEDFNYENWFHWTNPRALRALGTPGSPEGPSGLRARTSPGALASALMINKYYVYTIVILRKKFKIVLLFHEITANEAKFIFV